MAADKVWRNQCDVFSGASDVHERPGVLLTDYTYMGNPAGDGAFGDHANARHVFARLMGTEIRECRRMARFGKATCWLSTSHGSMAVSWREYFEHTPASCCSFTD